MGESKTERGQIRATMKKCQLVILIFSCCTLFLTLLSAILVTASHAEKVKIINLGWPLSGTFAWVAFVNAIVIIAAIQKESSIHHAAAAAISLCMFSAMTVALIAPSYSNETNPF